ncbi:MAG: glycosyltransferase family 2 protein [Desulfobacteraceae bacterium]|jgi:glycosyltransferase involved in cell wall biosynthesis|nr:glycosyltransferase family 2 protein [Desulfobacteraceae bacterium]
MKLIVQIPCYNEEKTLPQTVKDIPRNIPGIDHVEILVIDDGSSDRTVEVARELGVDHIVRNKQNKGLAFSFIAGLEASLRLGADIIVNTDGDNQYMGKDIPKLIAPVVEGKADIVIGDRKTDSIAHFSFMKKRLQNLGSWVVRRLSDTSIPDAVSGFRAFSRDAAMQLNIVSEYSYTVETVIQAGKKKLNIMSIPVGTNPKTRESRLAKSIPKFIFNQLNTMIRMYTMFKPLKAFFFLGSFCILCALIPSVRFLYFYLSGEGAGHIQSLIFASIFFIIGFQVLIVGLLGDVISFNRKLIEETLLRIKRIELDLINENNKK